MSGVSKFVKQRHGAGSPQNATDARPIDPARQARAANAKVSLKRGLAFQQPQQVHPPTAISSRGVGNLQNSAAFIQHEPQRRHSGLGFKRDLYDTDAESIDTTVDESVNQAGGYQARDVQYQEAVDDDAELDQDEDGSEGNGDDYHEHDITNYHFTQRDLEFLASMNMQDLSRAEALDFLRDAHPGQLPTIEGDSYPPTTSGDPSDWEDVQGLPPSANFEEDLVVSDSPMRPNANGKRPCMPPFKERGDDEHTGPVAGHSVDPIFKQSANLRGEQRRVLQQDRKSSRAHQGGTALSQPSPRLHASRQIGQAQPIESQPNQYSQEVFHQPHPDVKGTRSGPDRVALDPPKPLEVHAPAKGSSSAHDQVVPIIQNYPARPRQIESVGTYPHGDYDLSILHTMSYEQLKNESFDANPQAEPLSFPEETLQKPLAERLLHAQKDCDGDVQAHFFQSLPTGQWEEAGDWFLDQFSNIIQRTKEARQKKRKLAQNFEDEVEKRHKRVSKKQRQVENALNKMKAQGESLVPKSPSTSKSPRSKKARSDT